MCAVQHESSALLILPLARKNTPLICGGLPHGLLLLTIIFSV